MRKSDMLTEVQMGQYLDLYLSPICSSVLRKLTIVWQIAYILNVDLFYYDILHLIPLIYHPSCPSHISEKRLDLASV